MLSFLPAELIAVMQVELPKYLAMGHSQGDGDKLDLLTWWSKAQVEIEIPAWFQAFRMVMAIEPSSAETERVFSMMRNTWGDKQETALRDYVRLR